MWWRRKDKRKSKPKRGTADPPISREPHRPQSTRRTIQSPPQKKIYKLPDFSDFLLPRNDPFNSDALLPIVLLIEKTLKRLNAPVKVVGVYPGPLINRFLVEPGDVGDASRPRQRVRVQAVIQSKDELALELGTIGITSVAIEFPTSVAGCIAIDIPSDNPVGVRLRDIFNSLEFRVASIKSKLCLGLGLTGEGAPVVADLATLPHLLTVGRPRSGKSMCIHGILTCLLLQNSPDDLKLMLIDTERTELPAYEGIPHLIAPVIVEQDRVMGVLQWLQCEMEERFRKFSAIAARNIAEYNTKFTSSGSQLPHIVVVVEHVANLFRPPDTYAGEILERLVRVGYTAGIHVIASLRLSRGVKSRTFIPGIFPAKVVLPLDTSTEARNILQPRDTENLLNAGDMYLQTVGNGLLRVQGTRVEYQETQRITSYWRRAHLGNPLS